MSTPVRLSRPIALLSTGDTEPPKELRLFSTGITETTKGPFRIDDEARKSIADNFAALGRLLSLDYEHASVFALASPDPAEAGKSAGQFRVECRADGVFATEIAWTPKAREKILAREYVYTSPTFRHDEEGRVLEIFGCAITNDPAIRGASPIMTLTDTPDEQKAIGVLQGWKLRAEEAATLSQQLGAANARIAELERARATERVETVLSRASREGRLPPAMAARVRALGVQDPAVLEGLLSVMPVLGTARVEPASDGIASGPETMTIQLTEAERAAAGNNPKLAAAMLARKRELASKEHIHE
jgi:phage I-like protein